MIDFATSVLGRDVALRKTENSKGSKQNILIGSVKRINSGKVTKAVSCHQKLYPYLLYYCHSVPDVAVYEADILDPKTKKKINHGCGHLSLGYFFMVTLAAAGHDLKKANKENPLTPKAHLNRYWNKKINNNVPKSHFLLSKASPPLKAIDIANFAKLATPQNSPALPGIVFNIYGPYEDILKNDINFMNYGGTSNESSVQPGEDEGDRPAGPPPANPLVNKKKMSYKKMEPGSLVTKTVEIQPGTFFREWMLKSGTVMPMPDIKDKYPKTKFLNKNLVPKIPFSSSKFSDMKKMFHACDNSALEGIIKDAVKDCERKPNQGEIKRCVASAEDMIVFATLVLGRDVALRKTENYKGSKQDILIGSVKRINGGMVTKVVSCHQKLYPYLLYYCHSVPDVAVYEADILDPKTKKKINHGVAICHLDTSSWFVGHEAFRALGSGPGQIEVCHWIFEKDLIWTNVDH
ncbi:hypothetical protein Dsin_010348 [Dipteronia sinensis]|uniref:BURP domain-containing protein n=1 Tax=Dipteronia sinensis TaxID=43782 RepID=A0AAE0ASM8_9ROSI|nr:hypothetical protein Dsin_010348 [Dipteronia sinensis]